MWVKFTQTKNGLPVLCCRSMKSTARAAMSSSIVSIRFFVSGPVSLMIVCRHPCASACAIEHAARAELLAELGVLRVVGMLRFLLGVEVIEVAVELVEAVHRGQVLVAIAQVVLAELARWRNRAA